MSRQMTNIHWLWVAIHMCGGRPALAKLCKIGESCLTKWINEDREITLENAIKIEKAINGRVTRDQLISNRDKAFIANLKTEAEILKRNQPSLTFRQRVELGLAHEIALGCRKGVRTDLQLSKNFNEVPLNHQKRSSKKPMLQGRTEELAAELAGFGNFVTYHQAKKIIKQGIPELIDAVEKGLPISRALKICEHPADKQRYFLTLDRPLMIKALAEKICNKEADKWKNISSSNLQVDKILDKKDRAHYESTAAWALLSFNVTLFKNKKLEKILDEKNKIDHKKAAFQKIFSD